MVWIAFSSPGGPLSHPSSENHPDTHGAWPPTGGGRLGATLPQSPRGREQGQSAPFVPTKGSSPGHCPLPNGQRRYQRAGQKAWQTPVSEGGTGTPVSSTPASEPSQTKQHQLAPGPTCRVQNKPPSIHQPRGSWAGTARVKGAHLRLPRSHQPAKRMAFLSRWTLAPDFKPFLCLLLLFSPADFSPQR